MTIERTNVNDSNFTGTRMVYEPAERVKASVPFRILVQKVDNFAAGKIVGTGFDWSVEFRGNRIATRNVYKDRLPKTRKAAVAKARHAIREWCSNIHS